MGRISFFAIFLVVTSFVLVPGIPASAEETIGVVQSAEGSATITRGGKILSAATGTKLFAGDTLSTGPDGSVGITLRDDSTLSLGPESSLVIRKFLFSPGKGKLGFLARLSSGTMAYLSGLIGKLAPESVRIETPTSTIGIRGTRFVMKAGDPVSR
ncbi:MAG TPA: FecR family protein [Candidatus Deferrimicrobiaceae bacterium]|nr:FecR family protein [Candidatus Deferrimicrobiaceae bacterium]